MKSAKVDEENQHVHFSFLAQAYVLDGDGKKAIDFIISKQSISYPKNRDISDKRYLNYFLIKGNIYLTIGEMEKCY